MLSKLHFAALLPYSMKCYPAASNNAVTAVWSLRWTHQSLRQVEEALLVTTT